MKHLKQILAGVLAIIMMCGAIPVNAFAVADEKESVDISEIESCTCTTICTDTQQSMDCPLCATDYSKCRADASEERDEVKTSEEEVENKTKEENTVLLGNNGDEIIALEQSDSLQVSSKMTATVTYQVQEGNTLQIILPPFFDFLAVPSGDSSYEVKEIQVDLPDVYQTEDILSKYAEEYPERVKCQALEVTIKSGDVLSLDIQYGITSSTEVDSKAAHLSKLMLRYGEKANQIPLYLLAQDIDADREIQNSAQIPGNSTIPEAKDKIQTLNAEAMDFTGTYNTARPKLSIRGKENVEAAQWHYPYSNVTVSVPAPESVDITSIFGKSEGIKYDGSGDNRVAVLTLDESTWGNIFDTTSIFNIGDARSSIFTADLKDMEQLLPDDLVQFSSPVTISYTYLGEKYSKEITTSNNQYTVANYADPELTFSVEYIGLEDRWKRFQGNSDEYEVEVSNSQTDYMTYTYKDATVEITFPYEIQAQGMSIGRYNEAQKNAIKDIIYNTYENPQEFKKSTWDNSEARYTFAQGAHIKTVQISFDQIVPASEMTFAFDAINGTKNQQGEDLPAEINVGNIEAQLCTETGKRIACADDSNREQVLDFNGARAAQEVTLIRLENDTLSFGTIKTRVYDDPGTMQSYTDHLMNASTVMCTEEVGQVANFQSDYPWTFSAFNNSPRQDLKMQDYEDVEIQITPETPEDQAALGQLIGFDSLGSYTQYTEDGTIKIRYTTDQNDQEQIYTVNNTNRVVLPLGKDERLTRVAIDLGTLVGSKLPPDGLHENLDDESWGILSYSNYQIQPLFRTDVPDTVQKNYAYTLKATIRTSTTPAKYLNGPNQPFNNTSTGSIVFSNASIIRVDRALDVIDASNAGPKYRGDTVTFNYQVGSFKFNPSLPQVENFSIDMSYLRIYLEVKKGFLVEDFGRGAYDLLQVKQLENGNQLYIYQPNFERASYDPGLSSINVTFYIEPGAEEGQQQPIAACGIDYTPFFQHYDGTVAPYLDFEPGDGFTTNSFPPEWKALPAYGQTLLQPTRGTVTVLKAAAQTIELLPGKNDAYTAQSVSFREEDKDQLGAKIWLINNTDTNIGEYEAVFDLPRTTNTSKPSDFNMYLSGPVTIGDKFKVTYLDVSGREISNPADWTQVAQVKVRTEEFAAGNTEICYLPLTTNYKKTGDNIQTQKAYLTAKITKNGVEATADPAEYCYESYELHLYSQYDNDEDGKADDKGYNYPDVEYTAFYKNDSGELMALPTVESKSSTAETILKVNKDVVSVQAKISNTKWYSFGPNVPDVAENLDSDFPYEKNGISQVNVNPDDLTALRSNDHYTLNLIHKLKITAETVSVRVGQSAQANTPLTTQAGYQPGRNDYPLTFEVNDKNIATISETGIVTGKTAGKTEYTVTVTNSVGESWSDTGEIIVYTGNSQYTLNKKVVIPETGAVAPGGSLVYEITFTNYSQQTLRNTKVQERLPNDVKLLSASTGYYNGSYDADTNVWTLPELRPGQTTKPLKLYTAVSSSAEDGESLHNIAEVTSINGAPPSTPIVAETKTKVSMEGKVRLYFDSQGGTPVECITVDQGTAIWEDTVNKRTSEKKGYYFGGWYCDKECTEPFTSRYMYEDDTVYAKWLGPTITIKFDPQGGTPTPEDLVYQRAELTQGILVRATPEFQKHNHTVSRPGFEFVYWTANGRDLETLGLSNTTPDVVWAYAQWREVMGLTVDYETFGGQPVPDSWHTDAATQESLAQFPEPQITPKLDGMEFVTWYLNAYQIFKESPAYRDPDHQYHELMVNAVQQVDQYIEEEVEVLDQQLQNGEITEEEYWSQYIEIIAEYQNWLPASEFDGIGDMLIALVPALQSYGVDHITVYALWTTQDGVPKMPIQVHYDANGGQNPPATQTFFLPLSDDAKVSQPGAMSYDNHEFITWNTEADGSGTEYKPDASLKALVQDITLYAQWKEKEPAITQYTLTYVSNGGTEYPSEPYDDGTTVSLTKIPTRDGYTFQGWCDDVDLETVIDEIYMDDDKTVYAKWEKDSGGGAHHPEVDPEPEPKPEEPEEVPEEEIPLAETPWLNTDDHYAYIIGYAEDGTVRPNANITRAEVATIFFRLLTDEARDEFWSTSNSFSDVAPDAWYNNAVSTMVNAGIIQGYEDGTFRPNNNITRAEFAAIASRFMSSGYDVEEDLFTDIANHWARQNINDAAMTKWINGYPDGTFLPDKAITRAEAVTLVNNVLQRKPDADHLLDSMIKWPDNPEGAWYYEAIQEATNSHDYDLFEGAEYETWTSLLENRDWAALEKDWMNAHRGGGEVM